MSHRQLVDAVLVADGVQLCAITSPKAIGMVRKLEAGNVVTVNGRKYEVIGTAHGLSSGMTQEGGKVESWMRERTTISLVPTKPRRRYPQPSVSISIEAAQRIPTLGRRSS